MRSHIHALALATLAFAPHFASAQTAPAEFTGKWSGVLDIVHADGSVEPDLAYFSFTQDGDKITGVAGNSTDHLSPISEAKLSGNNLTFDVVVNPQMTVKFTLTVDHDRMQGTVAGIPAEPGSKIIIDARKADAAFHTAVAVEHTKDRLFDTVAALDQKLFDAYNKCDLATLGNIVTDDLEFYHDKTGLAVGKQIFVDSIRNNICGKTQRVLVPGTIEVYRLNHYGAVELGRHRFTHPGHEEIGVGEAKFITVWQFKDGDWKVSRVISYDHEAARQ
jgi:Domain of unknown function (DUF4440)